MHISRCQVGSYTGTGAAVSVTLGFKPVALILFNSTDNDVLWLYFDGMTDAHALQVANHDTAQVSALTSNGVTLSARGFSAGTSLSESAKVIRYLAIG